MTVTYTAPKTWSFKEAPSSTDFNTYIRDNFIALIDRFCPVGSIREFNVATNPATLMGFGTWAEYGKGRTTVAINSSDTEFTTVGQLSGEKATTLLVSQMPSHNHTDYGHVHSAESEGGTGSNSSRFATASSNSRMATIGVGYANISYAGGGASHNTIQPSITVYRWIRTA